MPSGAADLNVRYALGELAQGRTRALPAGRRGWGTRVGRVRFTEGTVVIDLRDTSTKSLVWRAIAREEKSDACRIEGKLDDMVKKAIEKYLPKSED